MSDYTDYAERARERYGTLQQVGQTDVQLEEAYVPLYAQRGPSYAVRDLPRAQKALVDARKRVRDEQIREAQVARSYLDLLLCAPMGPLVPISDIVSKGCRVVLRGEAGAGKTTALRFLVADRATKGEDDPLVLLVDLAKAADSGLSLPDYLAADTEQSLSLLLAPEFFADVLSSGQAILCLDGLDEVVGPGGRAQIVEQIESWVERFPRCGFVITSRGDVYGPRLDDDTFSHYVLLPWSGSVAADLASAWGEVTSEGPEEEALEQLATAPRLLRDIVSAREMVALFQDGKLNAGWQEIRAHLWDPSWRERISLVYRFLSEEQPETWGKAMSLLLEAGAGDPYGALHRYLLVAASALSASDTSQPLNEDVQKGIIDGLFGWVGDPQAAGRLEAVQALYRLTGKPYVVERALEVAGDEESDAWSRAAGVLIAGKLCTSDARQVIDLLRDRLEDVEEGIRVRQAAATALGHLATRGILEESDQQAVVEQILVRAQDDDAKIDVRLALTEALGMIALTAEHKRLPDVLVSLARGEGDEKVPFAVQTAAARALSALVRQEGTEQLTEQLWAVANDEAVDDSVRTEIAGTLGQLGQQQEAAHVLLAIADHPKVRPPGRRDAIEVLGQLGYSDDLIVEKLTAISETTDRKTKDFERLAAAKALADLGHLDSGLQHLLMLIADKSIYRTTRNQALALLGTVGLSGDEDLDSASIAVLQVWVTEHNTTEDVREQAMASLVMLGAARSEAVRDLIAVAQDKQSYPRVRRAAVRALGSLPVENRDLVVDSLSVPFYDPEDKNDQLRVRFARLLYLWGNDERAAEYLRAAAEQSYQARVRYDAGLVLKEIGDLDQSKAALVRLATDGEIADDIRSGSLRALSLWGVGDEELVDDLLSILDEEEAHPAVREAAYSAVQDLLTT